MEFVKTVMSCDKSAEELFNLEAMRVRYDDKVYIVYCNQTFSGLQHLPINQFCCHPSSHHEDLSFQEVLDNSFVSQPLGQLK